MVDGAFASARTYTIEPSAFKSFFRAAKYRKDAVAQALSYFEGRKKEIEDILARCEKLLTALNASAATELTDEIVVLKSSCRSMYGNKIDVLGSYTEELAKQVETILGDVEFDATLCEQVQSLVEKVETLTGSRKT